MLGCRAEREGGEEGIGGRDGRRRGEEGKEHARLRKVKMRV